MLTLRNNKRTRLPHRCARTLNLTMLPPFNTQLLASLYRNSNPSTIRDSLNLRLRKLSNSRSNSPLCRELRHLKPRFSRQRRRQLDNIASDCFTRKRLGH